MIPTNFLRLRIQNLTHVDLTPPTWYGLAPAKKWIAVEIYFGLEREAFAQVAIDTRI